MSLSDYDFAIRFRDTIKSIVSDILVQERPADKIGRVVSIDRSSGYAYVVYAGDEANPVKVKVYPSIQPVNSDFTNGPSEGSIVRVSGPAGGRYIAQILDSGSHQINSRLFDPTFASGAYTATIFRSFFTFSTTGVPLPDGNDYYAAAQLLFPKWSGSVDVYTELVCADTVDFLGNVFAVSYMQHDIFTFDSATQTATLLPATTLQSSSNNLGLTTLYNLYPNITGDQIAQCGINFGYRRAATSAIDPLFMNIHLDCRGSNAQLVQYNDGVL